MTTVGRSSYSWRQYLRDCSLVSELMVLWDEYLCSRCLSCSSCSNLVYILALIVSLFAWVREAFIAKSGQMKRALARLITWGQQDQNRRRKSRAQTAASAAGTTEEKDANGEQHTSTDPEERDIDLDEGDDRPQSPSRHLAASDS